MKLVQSPLSSIFSYPTKPPIYSPFRAGGNEVASEAKKEYALPIQTLCSMTWLHSQSSI